MPTIRALRTDKGFGSIKDAGGEEYFFHQSAVQGEGINDLGEGDSVEFDVGTGQKGLAPRRCGDVYVRCAPNADVDTAAGRREIVI